MDSIGSNSMGKTQRSDHRRHRGLMEEVRYQIYVGKIAHNASWPQLTGRSCRRQRRRGSREGHDI
eukprot:2984734-Pyramimonas_sp.AAC.1